MGAPLRQSGPLHIEAVTKRARTTLRKHLIAWWRDTEKSGINLEAPFGKPYVTQFEKEVYTFHAATPPPWLQAWGEFALTCFDVRADALSRQLSGNEVYVEQLAVILAEVLSLIDCPGCWPTIMVETRKQAGFYIEEENFTLFIRIGLNPIEHVRALLTARIEDWDAKHTGRLSRAGLDSGGARVNDGARREGLLPKPEAETKKRQGTDAVAKERKASLEAYKDECRQAGVRINENMIAEAASRLWHERTPVQRWKRNDPRSTPADDAKIRAVLKNKPHLK